MFDVKHQYDGITTVAVVTMFSIYIIPLFPMRSIANPTGKIIKELLEVDTKM